MYQESDTTQAMPRVSPWAALYKLIWEPGATFTALRERMPVLPGYLLSMVVMGIALAFTLPTTMNLTMDLLAKQPGYTPQAMQIARTFGMVGGIAAAVATPWIAGLLVAALAMFFGQFQGGGVSFRNYLGMAGLARVPLALGALVQIPLSMQAKTLQQMQSMTVSLAALVPADASPFLKAVAGSINPFDIWYYALLAIGFASLHKAKPAKALWLVLCVYILVLLVAFSGAASTKLQGLSL